MTPDSWQIRVPHRDRDAPIYEIVECARQALDGDDRLVAEPLVWNALGRGTTTVGGLFDEIKAAGSAGRRQILDNARSSAGLETASEIESAGPRRPSHRIRRSAALTTAAS